MRLVGIGIDLVDIERIERMLARKGDLALNKLLTPDELAFISTRDAPAGHVAVRIAAKEATYKALQTLPDARAVGWQDLEVVRNGEGRPAMVLHGVAARLARDHGPFHVQVSLSHSARTAGAVVAIQSLRDDA
jgi:holo-[acyl-carrier protein] synthase